MRNNRLFIFSFLLLNKLLFSQAAITSVSSPNSDGIYGKGDVVYIAVNFLENMYVTGTPILILETGTSNAGVNYSYGSGTKTLYFEYTVEDVHQSNDLEVLSFAPIMPGSDVSIKISSGSNAITTLTFPSSGATGSLSANKDIVIDGSLTIQRQDPTWSALSIRDANGFDLNGLHFFNSSRGFVVGNSGKIVKTNDGGVNWEDLSSSNITSDLNSVYFSTISIGWAVGDGGTIIRTTDGDLWQSVTSGVVTDLTDVFGYDANTGWAVGNSGTILKTTNGGSNWSSLTSGTNVKLWAIYFVNSNTGWAVGNSGTILKTTNGGSSWSSQTSGTSNQLSSVYFLDENVGWVAGKDGIILKTLNSGLSWTTVRNSFAGTGDLNSIYFTNKNIGWTVGDKNFRKTIDGSNFVPDSSFNNGQGYQGSELNDLYFVDSNTGYAVGNSNTIYKLSDTVMPNFTSVSSTVANGYYKIGDVIPITVSLDEPVFVTGNPQLLLETGSNDALVDYTSGSGTNTLIFNYTVVLGHSTANSASGVLDYNGITGNLQGGSIKDAAGNSASMLLPAIPSASLASKKQIYIDGWVPVLLSSTISTSNIYVTVDFTEGIFGGINPLAGVDINDFVVTLDRNGGNATAVSISSILTSAGTTNINGGETKLNLNLNITGLPSGSEILSINPANNSIFDIAGNELVVSNSDANVVTLLDMLPPVITSLSINQDNSLIEIIFSEPVKSYLRDLEKDDFIFDLKSSSLLASQPTSIAISDNKVSLGLSLDVLSNSNDTLFVRYYDNRIYDVSGANEIDFQDNDKRYFVVLNDVVKPIISSLKPLDGSFINKVELSYSLSENASNGTVTFTRTGGSADINSPHIVALTGNELTAGAKEGIVLTNSPSLVEGAIYTISFDVKDLAGNSANTQTNSNITFDLKAPTMSNLSYSDNAYINLASLPFSFSLSEIADSVTATYTRTGGSADPNSPHKLVFGAGSETVALSFNSATSFSAPNLVDGAVYDVSLIATDLAGNASAPLSAKSITFDITPPDIVGIFPKKDDILNSINLSYSLSEDVSGAIITWRSIGTVQDIASPHIKALSGDELKKGTKNNITLSNTPTLVDGGKYTLTLRATDLAGNVGMPYDISPVTYDFTPPSLKQTSADTNPFVAISKPSKVRLDFTEPIFSYDISISSKMNAKIDTSTSQSADSLIIDFIGPLTSLDTINIEVSNVIDRAGSKSELINVKLFTSLLADFNNDFRVDVEDLAALISTWPNVEMGPATGTIPYLTPQPDGKSNLRDIAVFTRLWRWSLNNNGAQRKMIADLGNEPSIEVNSNEIKFNISEDIRSGEVFIDYSRLHGSVSLKNNNIEENKVVIYEYDHEQKFLLVNFGALKAKDDDQIIISIERNNSQESGIDLDYRFFNEFAEVISSGNKEIELAAIPTEFALHNNYPNPFNPTTTMRFDLPIQTDAKVMIFNMLGQKVKTFDLKALSAGYHSVKWNARNDLGDPVGAGVYFYQLQTNNFTRTKKMVLLK